METTQDKASDGTTYDLQTGEIAPLGGTDLDLVRSVTKPFSMDLPDEGEFVYVPGYALHLRADAKAGQFKIGDNQFVGASADMEILHVNTLERVKLFDQYAAQDWLQIFYIRPDKNAVFHTLMKGAETLRNWREFVVGLLVDRRPLESVVVTATFVKREGTDKDGKPTVYYVLEFTYKNNTPERVAKIKLFRERNKFFDPEIESAIVRGMKAVQAEERAAALPDNVAGILSALDKK